MKHSDPSIQALLALMAQLRDPVQGCAWDRAQDFRSLVPHTIEEAYEVAEAIALEDWQALTGELGDLLFQVVFYSQLGRECGYFDFADVVRAITDKLVRRHPQVFGGERLRDVTAHSEPWEAHKAAERRAASGGPLSALDGVARTLPALSRAAKLQRRAAAEGFDWPATGPILSVIEEELAELREAMEGEDPAAVQEELGDLLFSCVNLSRFLGVDPEAALRACNAKFERRFRYIEDRLAAQDRRPKDATLAEMDALWNEAKLPAQGYGRVRSKD